jgi:hypothetical protein
MKTKFLILGFFSLLINPVSSQTIVDLDSDYPINQPNVYYKDISNKLNPFEGTWVFDNGTDYIKFVLVKKVKALMGAGNYYEDILIGEFQYKKNGVEKINTLPNLNVNFFHPYQHSIVGNYFWDDDRSPFHDYTTDKFRLNVIMSENDCSSGMRIRTLTLNGQSAIQIFKRKSLEIIQNCSAVIPEGFYYLMKQ